MFTSQQNRRILRYSESKVNLFIFCRSEAKAAACNVSRETFPRLQPVF